MIPEEQIERFFNKQCTPEEARQVANWLMSHPELAGKYLGVDEWQQSQDGEQLPEEIGNDVWYQLNREISRKKAILLVKRCAVAACIAGCIISGFLYLNKHTSTAPVVAYHKAAVIPVSLTDTEYNKTNKTRRIQLTDGSVVSLLPKAVIWFDTPFTKQQRDIHLRGEARFEVAKDKQRPFTVYAGNFATTALGTEFIVKQKKHAIKVQLLHGSVVIKATDVTIKNWKDVYLLPGEQMTFNENDQLPAIKPIDHKTSDAATHVAQQLSETADSLIFNGNSLPAVLQKLSDYYQVTIVFNETELKDMSFTGVIVKKDAVDNILKVLTQMNGLSLERSDSSFIISKIESDDTHP